MSAPEDVTVPPVVNEGREEDEVLAPTATPEASADPIWNRDE